MLVITPHSRLKLGPTKALQVFLEQQVVWLSLEELSRQPNLDPLLNLLTLPVRPESELAASSQQILASRPDLKTVVLPMLVQRFPQLTEEQIMVIAGIPREEIRHTRAVQDWLAEGRQEGRQAEASSVALRQLTRRCGPLSEATTAPRSRHYRWSSWKPWQMPCSTSRARQIWPPGWPPTAEAGQCLPLNPHQGR